MVGKSKAIGEELYNECKLELKKHGIRGEIGRRLQAIIYAKGYCTASKLPLKYNVCTAVDLIIGSSINKIPGSQFQAVG